MAQKLPTIGAAIITKNAKHELERLLPQLRKLDQVVVVDTGSTDGTRLYVKKLGRPFAYHQFAWRPDPVDEVTGKRYGLNEWGFAAARNFSFSKINTDYVIWLDSDDILGRTVNDKQVELTPEAVSASLRKLVSEQPDLSHWSMDYVYGVDQNGAVEALFHRDRLLNRKYGWTWVYPIHEVAVAMEPSTGYSVVKDVQVIHLPQNKVEQSGARNLTYLEKWHEQLTQTEGAHWTDLQRCAMLMGLQHRGMQDYVKSNEWFKEMLEKYPQSHELERFSVWIQIAKNCFDLKDYDGAEEAYSQAILIRPDYHDGYYGLARVKFVREEDPKKVLALLQSGAVGSEPPPVVAKDPRDYRVHPLVMASDSHFKEGDFEMAFKMGTEAIQEAPGDPMAMKVFRQAMNKMREMESKRAALALYEQLFNLDENQKAADLFALLPQIIQEDEEVRNAATKARERIKHLLDDESYEKLYTNNTGWQPLPDEVFESGAVYSAARYTYILSRLKQALPNGGRVLDVGCSDGLHTIPLAKEGYEMVGLDLDPRCVDLANERAKKWKLSAKFIHGFFEKMSFDEVLDPFDDQPFANHFDAVICGEVIEHVQDPGMLLASLGECAKDGAPILITTPHNTWHFAGGEEVAGMSGHVRIYNQETFEMTLAGDVDYAVIESHFLHAAGSGVEDQGWQVGEIRRQQRPGAPIVRIFCGGSIEPWSPDSIGKGGIGGSETAVIQLAKGFAKLNALTIVYGSAQGIWDGVIYRKAEQYKPDMKSHIFISWRGIYPLLEERPNADQVILWVHDVHLGRPVPDEVADRIDRVAILSQFHGNLFAQVHPNLADKLWLTRNGIDPARYIKPGEKVKHRYVYTSAPNRGLSYLLDIWPSVREAIPEAELHVAYGFDSSIAIDTRLGNLEAASKLRLLRDRVRATAGVVNHDRLNQYQLAELQKSAQAWLYPPDPFEETYCITALEMQAARVVPITRLNGALPEVIKRGLHWEDDWTVDDLVARMQFLNEEDPSSYGIKDYRSYDKLLDENYEWAMKNTWDVLAVEWLASLAPKEVADAASDERGTRVEEGQPVLSVINGEKE